jgi:hypothetical protein
MPGFAGDLARKAGEEGGADGETGTKATARPMSRSTQVIVPRTRDAVRHDRRRVSTR